MRVGIIRYPGSNCDNDALNFLKTVIIFHTQNNNYLMILISWFFLEDSRLETESIKKLLAHMKFLLALWLREVQ